MNKRIKIRFIINPVSGVGKQRTVEKLIATKLDKSLFDPEMAYTQHAGHARELAQQAVKDNVSVVAIVGGDGSVNEAASSVMGTATELAIVPTGSGNGIARHYKIPLKPEKAIEMLGHSVSILTDVGLINDRPFFGFAGIGFDAHIAHEFAKLEKRGLSGYAKLVIKEFRNYRASDLELSDGHQKYSIQPFLLTFSNVSQYGNGVIIDPQANSCDGTLAACVLENVSFRSFPGLFLRSIRGNIDRSGRFRRFPSATFSIYGLKESKIHIDGEPVLLNTDTLNIKLSDKKLKLRIPK